MNSSYLWGNRDFFSPSVLWFPLLDRWAMGLLSISLLRDCIETVWNPTVLSDQKDLTAYYFDSIIDLLKLGGSIISENAFPVLRLILYSKCKWHCSSVPVVHADHANHEAIAATGLAPWMRGAENQTKHTTPSSFVFVLTLITTKATPKTRRVT